MRVTKQRKIILAQLAKHKDHPTADIIYEEVRKVMPNISLGTIYRNLELLAESGKILKLEYGRGQKHFDPEPENHPHFTCLECGKIEDIPFTIEDPVIKAEELWTKEREIYGANIELLGKCPDCAPKM